MQLNWILGTPAIGFHIHRVYVFFNVLNRYCVNSAALEFHAVFLAIMRSSLSLEDGCFHQAFPHGLLRWFYVCWQNFTHEKRVDSVGSFNLTKGINKFCLSVPGVYQLTPVSCRQFEHDVYTYNTWVSIAQQSLHDDTAQWYDVLEADVWNQGLTLWCPLLPYGYSYKASCARPG